MHIYLSIFKRLALSTVEKNDANAREAKGAYIYMYVYIFIYSFIYVYMCVCVCMSKYIHLHIFIYLIMHRCVCIYIYIYMRPRLSRRTMQTRGKQKARRYPYHTWGIRIHVLFWCSHKNNENAYSAWCTL